VAGFQVSLGLETAMLSHGIGSGGQFVAEPLSDWIRFATSSALVRTAFRSSFSAAIAIEAIDTVRFDVVQRRVVSPCARPVAVTSTAAMDGSVMPIASGRIARK